MKKERFCFVQEEGEDEKIIFIDTDTLTMEEQEEMIQEENKNEQAKKL